MKFKVGDSVEVIDEAIKGRIVAIKGDRVVIHTEADFEMELGSHEIMKTSGLSGLHISRSEVTKALAEKEERPAKKKRDGKTGRQNASVMEVDLHIHQLVESIRGMDNYDMLTLQLETARKTLEYAMKNRIRNVVFIHGVGEGVLKAELEYLFNRYKNITYYDADFKKYGSGATEVYIYQNY